MRRPECPYPGPKPFESQDRQYFFGREREAREIVSLVIAHPAVLVYAESGAGKTSLLNARVIPMLQDRRVDVIGTTRVSGELPPGVKAESVRNIFTFHAILGLDALQGGVDGSAPGEGRRGSARAAVDPRTRTGTTLTEFLHARPKRESTREGEIVPPRMIVFDQFEEVFTTSPDRWEDRAAFFDDLGDALEADRNLRVALVMREEFVAALDPFTAAFPRRLRTRYRLERLRKPEAILAVTGPLEGTGYTLERKLAEKLVENLMRVAVDEAGAAEAPVRADAPTQRTVRAEFVEPVQLQVVCVQIWDSLPDPPATIDSELITAHGDVDRALSVYYERSLKLAVQTDEALRAGVTEEALRNWFDRILITDLATRGTVFRGAKQTGGLPNALVELLDTRFRLVRPELRGTATWYELTHDRFITPIRESNRRYFLAQSDVGNLLRARTEQWVQGRKKARYLLQPAELDIALAWKARQGPLAELGEVEEFLRESGTRLQIQRRVTRIAVPIATLAVVLLVTVLWTLSGKRKAERAMYRERGSIASRFASRPGSEFDALLLGVRAVGPNLEDGDSPPDSAVKGLHDALAAIGGAVFLRDSSSTQTSLLRFSPDGQRMLTIRGRTLTVWDAAGRPLFSTAVDAQRGGKDQAGDSALVWTDASFLPTGKRVIAFERWTPMQAATGRRLDPAFAAFMAARSSRPSWLRIFDAATGTRDEGMETLIGPMAQVGFGPDGTPLWGRGSDGTLLLYRRETGGRRARPLRLPAVYQIVGSPRGTRMAVETRSGVELRDAENGRILRSFSNDEVYQWELVFSPDDSLFVAGSGSGERAEPIDVWNTSDGTLRVRLGRNAEDVSILFSRDGRRILVHSAATDSMMIWNLERNAPERVFPVSREYTVGQVGGGGILLYQPDPKRQYTLVTLWDPFSGKPPAFRPEIGFRDSRTQVFLSDDGRRLGIVEPEVGRVRVFRLDQQPVPLDSTSVRELYRIGCNQLRTQPAEWKVIRLEELCGTKPNGIPTFKRLRQRVNPK